MGQSSNTTFCKEGTTPQKVSKYGRDKSLLTKLRGQYGYSYDNTLQSQFQLGSWKCKTNQLTRKYRFLYYPHNAKFIANKERQQLIGLQMKKGEQQSNAMQTHKIPPHPFQRMYTPSSLSLMIHSTSCEIPNLPQLIIILYP